MEIDAEMRRKIAVSVVAVALFIGLILGIGVMYSNGGALGGTGGLLLIGAIALFVVVMAGVGLFLSRS